MSVAYKVSTDWDIPLENDIFSSEDVARDYLEDDPELIAAMIEEDKTIQEFIDLGWISINAIEIITE